MSKKLYLVLALLLALSMVLTACGGAAATDEPATAAPAEPTEVPAKPTSTSTVTGTPIPTEGPTLAKKVADMGVTVGNPAVAHNDPDGFKNQSVALTSMSQLVILSTSSEAVGFPDGEGGISYAKPNDTYDTCAINNASVTNVTLTPCNIYEASTDDVFTAPGLVDKELFYESKVAGGPPSYAVFATPVPTNTGTLVPATSTPAGDHCELDHAEKPYGTVEHDFDAGTVTFTINKCYVFLAGQKERQYTSFLGYENEKPRWTISFYLTEFGQTPGIMLGERDVLNLPDTDCWAAVKNAGFVVYGCEMPVTATPTATATLTNTATSTPTATYLPTATPMGTKP